MKKKERFISTLIAIKVPSRRLKHVVQIINSYHQVTHNYLRNHSYNVWFTLKETNRSKLLKILNEIKKKCLFGIASNKTQKILSSEAQSKMIELPAQKVFKLKVLNYHRQARVNCLAVWQVPKNKICYIGRIMAKIPEISHCFQRRPCLDWPYNLYTMIHTYTKRKCLHLVQNILQACSITKYKLLYTLKKYKRGGVVFV